MSYKTEKLGQRIAQLQDYVASKGAAHPVLKEVREEIVKLGESLSRGKLSLNLISTPDSWAPTLAEYFNRQSQLSESFYIQTEDSPWQLAESQIETPPTIIWEDSNPGPNGFSHYELSPDAPVVIGRDPNRATLVVPDRIKMVSGSHATFKPLENGKKTSAGWQICDNKSTNGTFVNEQRIFGCQALEAGDRIVLGGPTSDSTRATFTFQYRPIDHTAMESLYQSISVCDVLCAVISPAALDSKTTEDLLRKCDRTIVGKIYLLVPGSDEAATARQKLQTLAQNQRLSLEILTLPLEANIDGPIVIENLSPEAQNLLVKLSQDLTAFAAKKVEDLLVNRLTNQLNAQVARIDEVLVAQEETLRFQFERENQMLNGIGVDELRERMRGLLAKAKEEKDLFFRQVRVDLNSAKTSALDPHSKRGIQGKVKQFTDELTPQVIVKKGVKHVQLKPLDMRVSDNIDLVAFQFCQKELGEWVNREWDRTLGEYADGGLQGLLQRLESNLTVTSSIISTESINQPIRQPNLTRSLQESILGKAREEVLKEDGFGSYMIKKFRSTWMMVGSLVMIGGTIFLPLMKVMFPSLQGDGKNSWFSNLMVSAPYLQIPIYGVLVLFIWYLVRDFKINKALTLEEIGTKLRGDLCNYYQSFAKDRIDRLLQEILLAMEAEDQRLKSALGRIEEQLSVQVGDIRKKLEDIKTRQQLIARERGDLKRLAS